MAISEILNPIFNPILGWNPFLILLVISLIVSILTTVIYKYTTNQERMKRLKKETKEYQEKLKKLKDKPGKMMKVQKEMMAVNMEYMKSSFRPMLFTIIPLLLFFGWLGANLAFVPLQPDVGFDVTVYLQEEANTNVSLILPQGISLSDTASKNIDDLAITWSGLNGQKGEHDLKFVHESSGEEQFVSILITDVQKYINPIHPIDSNNFNRIVVEQEKLLIFEDILFFKSIPWISGFGWLGAYILFSLIFSTSLRKLFKIA